MAKASMTAAALLLAGVTAFAASRSNGGERLTPGASEKHPLQQKPPRSSWPTPVRGFHAVVPGYWGGGDGKAHVAACERFIRDVLAPSGVNVLVVRFDYRFPYQSHPKLGDPKAIGPEELKVWLKACRAGGIKLIPEIACLGHQASGKGSLLGEFPQFREIPGEYPAFVKNPMPKQDHGTGGWAYCPRHPEVHPILFKVMDELADACESDVIHVGMDEVFAIASSNCPRCRNQNPAELFAAEVKVLRDHLASKGRKMWMWGDRLIDGNAWIEKGWTDWGWASSRNGTHGAIDLIPRDVVVCDWHYQANPPATAAMFVDKGLRVISCPWNEGAGALKHLEMVRKLAADPDPDRASRAQGVLHTTWVEWNDFITCWEGRIPPLDKQSDWQKKSGFPWREGERSMNCFKKLVAAWKEP